MYSPVGPHLPHQHPLDLHLIGVVFHRLHGAVLRVQDDPPRPLQDALQRRFLVADQRHDNQAVGGAVAQLDDDINPVEDDGLAQRIALDKY